MAQVRISAAKALPGFEVELTLTNGEVIQRNLLSLLAGPAFDSIRADETVFRQLRVEHGTLTWPNGADLYPDRIIWGGMPPADSSSSFAA